MDKVLLMCLVLVNHFTVNPSDRKHSLCASISLIHSGISSPLKTTHSSRSFLVSGQQQQILFPDLIPTLSTFFGAGGGVGADELFPMLTVVFSGGGGLGVQ